MKDAALVATACCWLPIAALLAPAGARAAAHGGDAASYDAFIDAVHRKGERNVQERLHGWKATIIEPITSSSSFSTGR